MTKSPAAKTWILIVGPGISIPTFLEGKTPEAAVDDYISGRWYLRDDDRSDDDFYSPEPAWLVDGDVDPPDWVRAELLQYIREHAPQYNPENLIV